MNKKAKPKPQITVIPPDMRRALGDRRVTADSEQLLADLIDVWGGTRKLALDLHNEFQHAGPGGMTRQRILEMIQRLVIQNTNQGLGAAIVPSDLPKEELERIALVYLQRMSDPDAAPSSSTPPE